MSYVDDFLLAEQSQDGLTKKQNKKKINELLDKYGESREAINEHADIKDSFAYMFAKGDELIDEVLEERRKVRQNKELLHQLQMEDLARLKREKKEVSLEDIKDLELSAEQKANIQQLDHSNQLAMIKALRERQDIDNYQSHPSMAAMRREAKSLHEALLQKTKVNEAPKQTEDKSSNEKGDGKNLEKSKTFDETRFINVTMKKHIEDNEGIVFFPYVDTADKITVGPGVNIDKRFKDIEWWYKNPQTGKMRLLNQTNEDDIKIIKSELAKLAKYKRNNQYSARYFENKTNLRISGAQAHQLYLDRINSAIDDVKDLIRTHNQYRTRKIADFEKLPEPLQIVLVDMVYNLGKDNFHWKKHLKENGDGFTGYPSFWEALEKQDINKMIIQSKRYVGNKPLVRRNEVTKKLLEKLRI